MNRKPEKKHIICNVGVSVKVQKNSFVWKRLYPTTCSCKNCKYVESIIDNSVITCNETIDTTKTVPKNFN